MASLQVHSIEYDAATRTFKLHSERGEDTVTPAVVHGMLIEEVQKALQAVGPSVLFDYMQKRGWKGSGAYVAHCADAVQWLNGMWKRELPLFKSFEFMVIQRVYQIMVMGRSPSTVKRVETTMRIAQESNVAPFLLVLSDERVLQPGQAATSTSSSASTPGVAPKKELQTQLLTRQIGEPLVEPILLAGPSVCVKAGCQEPCDPRIAAKRSASLMYCSASCKKLHRKAAERLANWMQALEEARHRVWSHELA